MAKHASPQPTFYRICATCEQSQWCSVCKTRKDEPKFSAAAWQRARNGGRVCLACLGKAWGWWRCTVCKVKQAACAFESWLAQHRSCNGDQVCSNFWKRPLPRGSISKAVQRVAATQAKVAVRAAEEKKKRVNARAIADVWAAIVERKRRTGEPSNILKRRKKRRRQNTARRERPQQEDSNRTEKGKSFQYVCPHCDQSVTSTTRTGQVDLRGTCGHRFRVREGRLCAKAYDYVCPACNGHVASNVATGHIDHRRVCLWGTVFL